MAPTTILEESEAEWAKDFCYATLAFDGSPVQIASTAKHAQAPNFPPNIESRASGDIITRLFIPASRSPVLRQVCRNRGTPRNYAPGRAFFSFGGYGNGPAVHAVFARHLASGTSNWCSLLSHMPTEERRLNRTARSEGHPRGTEQDQKAIH